MALLALDDGALALWSDRGGLYARPVDAEGAPSAEARRLGPPCPGGLAATRDGERVVVGCVQPGDPDRDRAGEVLLLDGDGATLGQLGPIRARSEGVSLDAHDGRVAIAYRDADTSSARALLAELRGDELSEATVISQPDTSAGAPSVRFVDGQRVVAWTESWYERNRETGHLLVQRQGDPPRPSLGVSELHVATQLAVDGERAIVTLRDRRPRNASYRSFTGHLDEDLRLEERNLHSPSRADAQDGLPQVLRCGEHRYSVATRRSSRGVTMVTLRRLGEDLDRAEDEHQIYEYHRRFPLAVGACVQDRLLVLVGERQTERQPVPRLSTYSLECANGVEHARTPL